MARATAALALALGLLVAGASAQVAATTGASATATATATEATVRTALGSLLGGSGFLTGAVPQGPMAATFKVRAACLAGGAALQGPPAAGSSPP